MSIPDWPLVPPSEVVVPVHRTVTVTPGISYRTLGVRLWGEGAYERQTIDGIQTAAKTLNQVNENDLIINKIWVRHGSVAVVGRDVAGCYGSNEFPTFEFRRELIEPRWMHWYSKSQELWTKCDLLSQGTSGKNRIRPEKFMTVEVPLPDLKEQQRLVGRIDCLVTKVAEARRLALQSDMSANQLTHSRFSFVIEGAPRMRMFEVAPLVRRKVEPQLGEDYPELGIRSFGRGSFHKPSLDYLSVGTKKLYRIEPSDLVFNNVFAWEGAIAVAKPEDKGRVGSHRFITCVAQDQVATAEFLCFYFLTPEGLEKIGKASTSSQAVSAKSESANAFAKKHLASRIHLSVIGQRSHRNPSEQIRRSAN